MSNAENCLYFENNDDSCEFAYFVAGINEEKSDMELGGYEMYQNYLLSVRDMQKTSKRLRAV